TQVSAAHARTSAAPTTKPVDRDTINLPPRPSKTDALPARATDCTAVGRGSCCDPDAQKPVPVLRGPPGSTEAFARVGMVPPPPVGPGSRHQSSEFRSIPDLLRYPGAGHERGPPVAPGPTVPNSRPASHA